MPETDERLGVLETKYEFVDRTLTDIKVTVDNTYKAVVLMADIPRRVGDLERGLVELREGDKGRWEEHKVEAAERKGKYSGVHLVLTAAVALAMPFIAHLATHVVDWLIKSGGH